MKTVALGDIVEEFRYGTSNKSKPVGEPTLRIPNVVGGAIDTVEIKTVPVEASEFERLRLAAGDLLFVRSNGNPANVGRCAVFEPAQVAESGYPSDRFIYASYLIRARLRGEQVEPAFVARYLSTSDGRRALMKSAKTSAGQFNINIVGLSAVTIPLPSINEQRRIAGILDQADAIRAKRRQVLSRFDTLAQAIFHDMFGFCDSDLDGSDTLPLEDVLSVKSGSFLPAKAQERGPYPVYGGNGVNGQHSEYLFEDPKVVIGRVGAYCGVVHLAPEKSWITDNALYVSSMKRELSLTYLRDALAAANLNQYASQSGQPLISASRIREVLLQVPPIDAQLRYEHRVDRVDAQRAVVRRALDVDNELFASLQSRAFRGEL